MDKQTEMIKLFIDEVKKGTIVLGDESETVVDTKFEDVPKTWMMLFSGGNKGKLVTKLVG
jgi:NADPH-dependent curcumin reductase CurA